MDNEYYISSDLGLSTTLSLFTKIEKIDKANPRKVRFFFKKDKKLDEIVNKYWNKKLRVDPLAYYMQIRSMKNMIYEQSNQA